MEERPYQAMADSDLTDRIGAARDDLYQLNREYRIRNPTPQNGSGSMRKSLRWLSLFMAPSLVISLSALMVAGSDYKPTTPYVERTESSESSPLEEAAKTTPLDEQAEQLPTYDPVLQDLLFPTPLE
tara:strand:- start:70 stop:450 length:381 start_codon:yes stop_codon:yes gene_type:complete